MCHYVASIVKLNRFQNNCMPLGPRAVILFFIWFIKQKKKLKNQVGYLVTALPVFKSFFFFRFELN